VLANVWTLNKEHFQTAGVHQIETSSVRAKILAQLASRTNFEAVALPITLNFIDDGFNHTFLSLSLYNTLAWAQIQGHISAIMPGVTVRDVDVSRSSL
jgi:hypothetical protein